MIIKQLIGTDKAADSQGKAASCLLLEEAPPDPVQDGVPTGFSLHTSTSCSHKARTMSHWVLLRSARNLRVQDSGAQWRWGGFCHWNHELRLTD